MLFSSWKMRQRQQFLPHPTPEFGFWPQLAAERTVACNALVAAADQLELPIKNVVRDHVFQLHFFKFKHISSLYV